MSQQIINTGVADKGNGDPIRTAFTKVNANFAELYNSVSAVVVTGATAPTSPGVGDLWWDAESGRMYVYYGTSWVDASPVDGVGIPTSTVPEHSYGVPGNVEGMVAFDDFYIYYCTGNYVNTSTNIWKRVALDATPW